MADNVDTGETIEVDTIVPPPDPDEETGDSETAFRELWEKANVISGEDLPVPGDEGDFPPVPTDLTEEGTRKLDDHAKSVARRFREMQAAKRPLIDATPPRAGRVGDSRPGPATPAEKSRVAGNPIRDFKSEITKAKKDFFLKKFKVLILKKDAKELYDKTDLIVGSISSESGYTSINFKNVEIAKIDDSGDVKFNKTKEAGQFKEALKKGAAASGESLEFQMIEMAEIKKNPNLVRSGTVTMDIPPSKPNLGRSETTTTDTDAPKVQPQPASVSDEGYRSQIVADSDIPQEVINEIIEEVVDELEADRERTIEELRTELRRAADRNADLEDRLREVIVEAENLKDSVVDKEENIDIQSSEIRGLSAAIDNLRLDNDNLRLSNRVLNDNSVAKIVELKRTITALKTKNASLTTTRDNLASDLGKLREEIRTRKKGVTEKGLLTEKELSDLEALFDDNKKEGREDQLTAIADIESLIEKEKEGPETFNENLTGRLAGLDANIKSLKEKADASDEGSPRQIIFRLAERAAERTKDYLSARYGKKVESAEGKLILKDIVDESPRLRFERFKTWAKENLGALAAVAISIGGIISTVVVGARSALRKGANALGKLSTALWNAAGKVAPVFGALLGLAAQIISLGAKGVAFLANNLWLLILAITYYLYEEWKDRRARNRQKTRKRD